RATIRSVAMVSAGTAYASGGLREPLQDLEGVVDATVRLPFVDEIVGVEITEPGDQGAHAGRASRIDVTAGVADVETVGGRDPDEPRRVEHRLRVGFAIARGIAADDARRAPLNPETGEERVGQPGGL